MGKIITFYSYKGGVGRSMSLANTAIVLSQWGYSVLMIDFDLEAPGLPNFFKSFIDISVANNTRGLVDFLSEINGQAHASLLEELNLVEINLPHPMGHLSLVTAGKQDDGYFRKLQALNFREFYSTLDGGRIIEEFRENLKSSYDFILVDSRTGLTDIGGICTVQLPDLIALIFSPTNQAFEGGIDIVRRASKARQRIPFPRPLVPILPVPSRFDTQTEFLLSQKWLDRFAFDLRDLLSDWMPRGSSPRSLLEITKLPYISYFGFGESLPVIEQGVTDPSGLGFAYESVSALLARGLEEADLLLTSRDMYIRKALKGKKLYTAKELDSWVNKHFSILSESFFSIPAVQAKNVHVPLDICIKTDGRSDQCCPQLLKPSDLDQMLKDEKSHALLVVGEGGSGKTSLAFTIARWLTESKPDNVRRLPMLIETQLSKDETVVDRAQHWLNSQVGLLFEKELVEALIEHKRLIPIIDHISEFKQEERDQLLNGLPKGLVIITSRIERIDIKDRPQSIIEPQRIRLERLQEFFLAYLHRQGASALLSDDELLPAQMQLRRIVGDKPITILLAKMFIDDVIAHRNEGLLAGSVPELMLSYVRRLDTPADPAVRRREGLEINEILVQRALRVVALASYQQGPEGQPLLQPLEFGDDLALKSFMASAPIGLSLDLTQSIGLLNYLVEIRLLVHPGGVVGRLCFPLNALADYLAAAEQFEHLEKQAFQEGPQVWETYLEKLERRTSSDRDLIKGFVLALRDEVMEAQRASVTVMPTTVADRLAILGSLDPESERYRLAIQRARKWVWELSMPDIGDRRDAISKLASMVAPLSGAANKRAVRDLATQRLASLLSERPDKRSLDEQKESAMVLGMIATSEGIQALEQIALSVDRPVELRRVCMESLGLAVAGLDQARQIDRERLKALLKSLLQSHSLNVLVQGVEGWEQHDRQMPLIQGAARGVQLAAVGDLPIFGTGPGLSIPMLTLTSDIENEGLRISTRIVNIPVWALPLPNGEQLELIMVPGGEYEIGSPLDEYGRENYTQYREYCESVNVEAKRKVLLDAFAMARYPITQAQWHAVADLPSIERDLKPNPASFLPNGLWEQYAQVGSLPVDSISWGDAQEWLRRLNSWLTEKMGQKTSYSQEYMSFAATPRLVLPSESQWEVACRAGSLTPFHFGATLDSSWANFDGAYSYGLGRTGEYRMRPLPIGFSGIVNLLGLADMHGQLHEWCADIWHRDPVRDGWNSDGRPCIQYDDGLLGSSQQEFRLLRGGGWFNETNFCRSANRYSNHPEFVSPYSGFRPCCILS